MRQRQRIARKKRTHPSKAGMRAKVAKRPEQVASELGGKKMVSAEAELSVAGNEVRRGVGLCELGTRFSTVDQHSAIDLESEVLQV